MYGVAPNVAPAYSLSVVYFAKQIHSKIDSFNHPNLFAIPANDSST